MFFLQNNFSETRKNSSLPQGGIFIACAPAELHEKNKVQKITVGCKNYHLKTII
jgi:hypothetical protein